jgi:hypothetical protein
MNMESIKAGSVKYHDSIVHHTAMNAVGSISLIRLTSL